MKIKLHDNGWTVLVEDLAIQEATQEEINIIGNYLAKNTTVVLRNQHLTVQDEIDVCSKFGNVERLTLSDRPKHAGLWVDGSDNKITRVTGALNDHGHPGLFGHISDLDWHCNASALPDRMPIVWMYAVEGTVGSRTSFINNINTYEDLQKEDLEFFDLIKDLKVVCGFEKGRYSEISMNENDKDINPHFTPNLVHTNVGRKTGFYCSPNQIFYFEGMTEEASKPIIEKLRDFIFQEKYMYHHDWQNNDLLFSEQWLNIHKRWRFEDIEHRLLHRMCVDFANIKFD